MPGRAWSNGAVRLAGWRRAPFGVLTLLGSIDSVEAALTRQARIAQRERNPKWKNPPLRIEMSECINCDACLRHCPPQFGAIFNHGIDVIIIPELCSGCDKCLPACPVGCIYPDPEWKAAPDDWWEEPLSPHDPYRT
jgi:electron transport complex protein RnfB